MCFYSFFSTLPRNFNTLPYGRSKPQRPSLARIILSLESNASKQQALQHILNALHILYAREAVVSALTPHGGQPSSAKLGAASNPILDGEAVNKITTANAVPLASPESPSDINEDSVGDLISGGGGEAPACPNDITGSLQTSPESEEPSTSNSAFGSTERGYTKLSSLPHGVSPTSVMAGAMISASSETASSVDPESLRLKQVSHFFNNFGISKSFPKNTRPFLS